jgi:hypothetical protein
MAEKKRASSDDDFDFPEGWRPKKDEVIRGTIVGIDMGGSKWGDYPIFTMKTDDGPVAIHAFHTVLFNALERVHADLGMKLAIKYLGKKLPVGSKNTDPDTADDSFHAYQVRQLGLTADSIFGAKKKKGPSVTADDEFNDEAPF